MVGGTEAALTDFSIAQMQAMKIYSLELDDYPCKALLPNKTKNTMVLGDGAVMVALDKNGDNKKVKITGIGFATEPLAHSTSISANGTCFVKSMQMALEGTNHNEVDVVVMHAPGTIKGDLAEINAVHTIFNNQIPALTNNKWLVGHTFGASGLLSLQMACLMLQEQEFFEVPYLKTNPKPQKIQKILVNAVGFGGNAVSVLVEI
jgi:3-oxoacyl-(acyl-carrier-protein) synthase